MGWMEGFWERADSEQIRLRPIRQTQELPRKRLPQIDATAGDEPVLPAILGTKQIVPRYDEWQLVFIEKLTLYYQSRVLYPIFTRSSKIKRLRASITFTIGASVRQIVQKMIKTSPRCSWSPRKLNR